MRIGRLSVAVAAPAWGHPNIDGFPEPLVLNTSGDTGNGGTSGGALSQDARFVAFASSASDLVPGDSNGVTDVFVLDRSDGGVERVLFAPDGAQANGSSSVLEMSPDARFVLVASSATNLVPGDTNGVADVFLLDRLTEGVRRVSVADDGSQLDAASVDGTLSADGRFVAFSTEAQAHASDTDDDEDVFLYDRADRSVRLGSEAAGDGYAPRLSADGSEVLFLSWSQLLATDTNFRPDVYVREIATGALELVSVGSNGVVAIDGVSYTSDAEWSPDGRYVVFSSHSEELRGETPNGDDTLEIYLRDRVAGTTTWVSYDYRGRDAWGHKHYPTVNDDGSRVAFITHGNLVRNSKWCSYCFVPIVTDTVTEDVEQVASALDNSTDWLNPAQVDDYIRRLQAGERLDPITVQRLPDGRQYILDGHHRYVASQRTGIPIDIQHIDGPGPMGLPDWSKVTYEPIDGR